MTETGEQEKSVLGAMAYAVFKEWQWSREKPLRDRKSAERSRYRLNLFRWSLIEESHDVGVKRFFEEANKMFYDYPPRLVHGTLVGRTWIPGGSILRPAGMSDDESEDEWY